MGSMCVNKHHERNKTKNTTTPTNQQSPRETIVNLRTNDQEIKLLRLIYKDLADRSVENELNI